MVTELWKSAPFQIRAVLLQSLMLPKWCRWFNPTGHLLQLSNDGVCTPACSCPFPHQISNSKWKWEFKDTLFILIPFFFPNIEELDDQVRCPWQSLHPIFSGSWYPKAAERTNTVTELKLAKQNKAKLWSVHDVWIC